MESNINIWQDTFSIDFYCYLMFLLQSIYVAHTNKSAEAQLQHYRLNCLDKQQLSLTDLKIYLTLSGKSLNIKNLYFI